MSDFTIAVSVLVLTAGIGLTGFGGKHVLDKPAKRAVMKRITWRGYTLLVLTATVLALNIWSEVRRESSLSGRLPEKFYELTENVTGYGQDEWNRYIAMRLSLRYLLGKLYKNTL